MDAPKMGPIAMKVIGRDELENAVRTKPAHADDLHAWWNEMRHRTWTNLSALTFDFKSADASRLPVVIFRVGNPPLLVETLLDLQAGVILLVRVGFEPRPDAQLLQMPYKNE